MMKASADDAQRLVLRWVVVVLVVMALALVTSAWWRNSRACRLSCEAQGKPGARLEFKGGGRFELGTTCVCGGDAEKK